MIKPPAMKQMVAMIEGTCRLLMPMMEWPLVQPIEFHDKKFNRGQIYGGLLFGLGWAMTGACPGPLFAQIGAGFGVVAVVILSATAGTWVYGYYRDKLPH